MRQDFLGLVQYVRFRFVLFSLRVRDVISPETEAMLDAQLAGMFVDGGTAIGGKR